MLVLQNRVKLVPEEQAFIISGDNHQHLVKLHPQEICTCMAKTGCHHITAAKLSIGLEEQKKRQVKLTKLVNKKRSFRSGKKSSGKIVVVESAENAAIIKPPENTTVLISTIAKKKLIKSRFYTPFSDNSTSIPKEYLNCDNGIDYTTTNDYNCSFGVPQGTSTPIKRKISAAQEHSDVYSTFSEKFKGNKHFIIYGRAVYPFDLNTLTPQFPKSRQDYYLSDTILDIYLPILYMY